VGKVWTSYKFKNTYELLRMFAGDFYFGRERDGGGSLATVVRSRSISSGVPRNPIAFRRNTPGRNTVGCHVKESNTVSEERSSDTIERPRDAECGIAINRLTTGELKIHMEKADAKSIMQEAPHVAFILVAFGYILTWTFLGSLIKYFTAKFGAQFFVYMNVAFYIVGYPTSYCQKVYDTMYDVKYTANVTYQARGILCLLAMTGCVILIPPATEEESGAAVLALTAIIGVLTWAMHGIATCLASVIKYDSPTYQQIGFMLPGFYCLAFILSQNYGEETTTDQLWLPFGTTAGYAIHIHTHKKVPIFPVYTYLSPLISVPWVYCSCVHGRTVLDI
jgi:hypothetical protein